MDKTYKEIIENLDQLSYNVTQKNHTEPPFDNEYNDHFKKGIYIDKISRDVLFISDDKFNSGCGWPAFSKPADVSSLYTEEDYSHGMTRTEVRSKNADSHLGHVFNDGPVDKGGLRYCINSAALLFIDYDQMEELGYADYKKLFKKES